MKPVKTGKVYINVPVSPVIGNCTSGNILVYSGCIKSLERLLVWIFDYGVNESVSGLLSGVSGIKTNAPGMQHTIPG